MRKVIFTLAGILLLAAMGVGTAAAQEESQTYVVQAGDTLSSIAARFGLSEADIAAANGLIDWNAIRYAQTLAIPLRLGTGGAALTPTAGIAESAPPAYQTYIVQGSETLADIAARFGISKALLMEANGITQAKQIEYIRLLRIPSDGQGGYTDPNAGTGGTGGPTAYTVPMYTVQYGETLGEIAARFGVSEAAIAAANSLANPNLIRYSDTLVIPNVPLANLGSGGYTDPKAGTGGPTTTAPATTAPTTTAPTTTITRPTTYMVHTGDTLGGIAASFGLSTEALAAANGIANLSYVQIGQVLAIPR